MFIGASVAEQIQHASDPQNYITLCEDTAHGNHHLQFGHDGNFAEKCIPNVEEYIASRQIEVRQKPMKAAPLKAIVFPWQKKPQHVITVLDTAWNRSHSHSDTPPIGFISDYYTDAPDLPDKRPAVHHDHTFTEPHQWDDGTPVTFAEANDLFLFLCQTSTSFWTRFFGPIYFSAVCEYGQPYWDAGLTFKPRLAMLWKHKGKMDFKAAFWKKASFE